MNASAERSVSVWGRHAPVEAPRLEADETADVAVVGAGIAGLSIAYELARAGRSVVVVDRGPIGGGMTARTTGHLASEIDDYCHVLIEERGLDAARQVCRAQIEAVDRIEAIVREEEIDCDFTRLDGYLFLAPGTDPADLEKEYEAARRLGLEVFWADRAPIPGVRTGRCLRFPNQGRFHPLKYLDGLVRALRGRGARLYADTVVNDVAEEEDGTVVARTAQSASVRARACAVATNSPFNEVEVHYKQAPYRTYAIAGRVPRGSVEDALFWDTLDPYHYVRLQPADDASDWLISGGEDHKTAEADDMEARFMRLEEWTRAHFPPLGAVERRWSGQVLEPVDHTALIGRGTGQNVFVATGDSGQGLTNGVAAGRIIGALIEGRELPYAEAHDPQRAVRGAIKEFLAENLDAARKLLEKAAPAEVSSVDEIAPGEGAIMREGLQKLAVYRAPDGAVVTLSAECTHAGCIVRWNPFEQCWDCPCHGSHFAPDGTAVNAPAVEPLARPEG
jgi:glycine/D-amino acid oxidase-like deaminating enzyme/nitrite reductase/ring-hydroxylating ferredoxin subunit